MSAVRLALAAWVRAMTHGERRAARCKLALALHRAGREATGWQADAPCG